MVAAIVANAPAKIEAQDTAASAASSLGILGTAVRGLAATSSRPRVSNVDAISFSLKQDMTTIRSSFLIPYAR